MTTPDTQEPYLLAAAALGERLRATSARVCTAESCTGGLIAAALTDLAGSSAFFWGGWVTYANDAKERLLGVPADLLARHGAVSQEVAEAMACGALAAGHADYAIAVTGVAGPGGGTPSKPVGLVWFGFAGRGNLRHTECLQFSGDRADVRMKTVQHALHRLAVLMAPEASAPG